MFKPGRAIHPSNATGSAPDAATTPAGIVVSFDAGTNRTRQTTTEIIISNRESVGGNFLEVSFDDGRRWFAINPASTFSFPVMCHYCSLRGYTGAVARYSVLGIIA